MCDSDAYLDWVSYLSLNRDLDSNVTWLFLWLPSLPIPPRKVIVDFARVQPRRIEPGDLFYERHFAELTRFYDTTPRLRQLGAQNSMPLSQILRALIPHNDSLFAGILCNAVISAPYLDLSSVYEVKEKTLDKEIEAAVNVYHPVQLNYPAIFNPTSAVKESLIPGFDPDPYIQSIICSSLTSFRNQIRENTLRLYPKISTKTIGKEAIRQCNQILEELGETSLYPVKTIADVERVRMRIGLELEGPVEMRSAWKFNDLKPRVYYAQGPTVYHASKYIQAFFNRLVDCLQTTHRYNRFSLPTSENAEFLALIYDYSSFTSKLHEIRRFTRQLADFFQGIQVEIIDTIHGPMNVDLGEMLLEFTETCNENGEFDIGPLCGTDVELLLHNCGMLGVPGNISSCTLLHGIHLSVLIGRLQDARCVGDDALALLRGVLRMSDPAVFELLHHLRNIGDLAPDKVAYWEKRGEDADNTDSQWQYCKRPINRDFSYLVQGGMVRAPSFELTLGLKDDIHRSANSMRSPATRARSFCKQVLRCLRQLWVNRYVGDRETQSSILLVCLVRFGYRSCQVRSVGRRKGRKRKDPGVFSEKDVGPIVFDLREDQLGMDVMEILAVNRHYGDIELSIPLEVFSPVYPTFSVGETCVLASSPPMHLAEMLGLVVKEVVFERRRFNYGTDLDLIRFYTFSPPEYTYEYEFVDTFPSWLKSLLLELYYY